MNLADSIKQKARQLGFDLVGITDASPIDADQFKLFTDWLDSGYAGRMSYMHQNLNERTNPAKLLKNAQSLIVIGLNYTPPKTQKEPPEVTEPKGRVANYARYEDYHPFIKKQLRKLTEFIISIAGEGLQFKICVDSAPLAERALALRAGLGFIGKNHMLINPKLGPQILLGEIITNLKLEPDKPISCHSERSGPEGRAVEESIRPITANCSDCNKCLTACPTGALRADSQFDANKCISYLTIEYKDRIPPDLAEKIGDRLFGCDECVLACPYQTDVPTCSNADFTFYPNRAFLNLKEILKMTEYQFKTRFFNSPLARTGLQKLRTTAELCLRNISE
jgi:epoxyqueuosine reductase